MEHEVRFYNKYWIANKILLKTIGQWPQQRKLVKISLRTMILLALHSMMIPQMIRTATEWGKSLEIVVENITGFFIFQAAITKYIANFQAESKLRYLYQQIDKDWNIFRDDGEQQILQECARRGYFLTIFYCVYLCIIGVSFTSLPGLIPVGLDLLFPLNESREKRLCYYGEYFIDQNLYYKELYVHTFISVMAIVAVFITIDTSYICCVEHILALFGIVDYRLNRIFKVAGNKQYYSKEIEEEIHRCVLSSIAVHNKALESVILLQSTYSTCFFFTITCILLCLSFGTVDVMLSLTSSDYINILRVISAWFSLIVYLFYICMPGQRILDASSKLFDSIYSCGWYNAPLKTQRLLQFMLLRCEIPCQITAGPIFVMNLENCCVVLKSAMSYCTFVAAMN